MGFQGWSLVVIVILCFSGCTPYELERVEPSDDGVTYTYDRIDEAKGACESVLSSAVDLGPDGGRVHGLQNELSFVNGDWEQAVGEAPLMIFEKQFSSVNSKNSYTPSMLNSTSSGSPVNLASFWVTEIDQSDRGKKFISINGVLNIRITQDWTMIYPPYESTPQFWSRPGHSELNVLFQGIYGESKENGGERVLCLLGNAMLPSKQPVSADRWKSTQGSGSNLTHDQPHLLQDDQILLVIRYPQTPRLTSIAIHGDMKSLNPKTDDKYFDDVHFVSQMSSSVKYKFVSGSIVSKACDPYPSADDVMKKGIKTYRGPQLCSIINQLKHHVFTIVPNWNCTGVIGHCNKLGPFVPEESMNITGKDFKGIKLLMTTAKCDQTVSKNGNASANVFAVFRAVLPTEIMYISRQKSGLSNMTLVAEGIWSSSTGQLCMVGCIGISDLEGNACDSRVCLYFPVSFSIKQRSISVGSFSSLKTPKPYAPLSFEISGRLNEILDQYQYVYSKLEVAEAIRKRNDHLTFGAAIKKSILEFPRPKNSKDYLSSVYDLWEDLSLRTYVVPDQVLRSSKERAALSMKILSIGSFFGRKWLNFSGYTLEEDISYRTKAELTETQSVLNVSAELTLGGDGYSNFSVLFLEGLYDPRVGKMYLAGCRDIGDLGKILNKRMDLESGLDCSVEVVISYPPSTTYGLVNAGAGISISSKRKDDDPLYFAEVKIQSLPILYRSQSNDILSRRVVEAILRIVTLSLAIICILSQLLYIRGNSDAAPYMSLVMLGVQVLGYSLPLVTGAESILHRKSSANYLNQYYYIDSSTSQWSILIDNMVNFLVLLSFLLTLRLCQKVWKSRIRSLTRSSLQAHRIPSDKWVVFVAFVIHFIGYLIVLTRHASQRSNAPDFSVVNTEIAVPLASSQTHWEWETKLEEYVGLVQDFFLLPQVIGNLVWQLDRKPLRNLYFIGNTVVRVLPHVYDYLLDPIQSPYFSENDEFVNSSFDFYSKSGDIFIPLMAIVLAIVVYIQQRWSYETLSQNLTLGGFKLLPIGRGYQRLPPMTHEAELSGAVVNAAFKDGHHHDEE